MRVVFRVAIWVIAAIYAALAVADLVRGDLADAALMALGAVGVSAVALVFPRFLAAQDEAARLDRDLADQIRRGRLHAQLLQADLEDLEAGDSGHGPRRP